MDKVIEEPAATLKHAEQFIGACGSEKRLDKKTIKAYQLDLYLYFEFAETLDKRNIGRYIKHLQTEYQPYTTQRKICSLKAFSKYLISTGLIKKDPLAKVGAALRYTKTSVSVQPDVIRLMFVCAYHELTNAENEHLTKQILRDIAVLEMIFSTGIRVSELCALKATDVSDRHIKVDCKGKRARVLNITAPALRNALNFYRLKFAAEIEICGYFFVNKFTNPVTEDNVRRITDKYARMTMCGMKITPTILRNTYEECLRLRNVNIYEF